MTLWRINVEKKQAAKFTRPNSHRKSVLHRNFGLNQYRVETSTLWCRICIQNGKKYYTLS